MASGDYQKQYYIKNKEKIQAYGIEYRKNNKEKIQSYRLLNKEKILAAQRAYYERNRTALTKTGTRNKKWTLEELEAKLGPRPNCCNPGCGKPAYQNGHRWTMFCSSCRNVTQGRKDPLPGITYLRKNMCANADGRADLGFPCFTNWKLVKKHGAKIATHMDHVDGNHLNNDPNNLMELCPYCHDEKGRQNGDKNGWKNKVKQV